MTNNKIISLFLTTCFSFNLLAMENNPENKALIKANKLKEDRANLLGRMVPITQWPRLVEQNSFVQFERDYAESSQIVNELGQRIEEDKEGTEALMLPISKIIAHLETQKKEERLAKKHNNLLYWGIVLTSIGASAFLLYKLIKLENSYQHKILDLEHNHQMQVAQMINNNLEQLKKLSDKTSELIKINSANIITNPETLEEVKKPLTNALAVLLSKDY